MVAGWGAVKFRGPTSPVLLEGLIKVVNNTDCSDKFKSFRQSKDSSSQILKLFSNFSVKINKKKLCARDLNNKVDTCQGKVLYDYLLLPIVNMYFFILQEIVAVL